jgi:hypothetical protein
MRKFKSINTSWFFSDLHPFIKFFLMFIKGDMIVLLPFLIIILLLGFFSMKFMVIMLGIYIAVRYFGELIYWLFQQFNERKFRPYDFGFKNLDNHAIYILYQNISNYRCSIWTRYGCMGSNVYEVSA